MRGTDRQTGKLFSYASPEGMVPGDHPPRAIRELTNAALDRLPPAFAEIYSEIGRSPITPEKLPRAFLLQAFFCALGAATDGADQLQHVVPLVHRHGHGRTGVGGDRVHQEPRPSAGRRHNARPPRRDRDRPQVTPLLSTEHFSVDGTLIEAWDSMKSFRPKDGSGEPAAPGRNGERDFHGEKRSNETHASATDPDARLYRKGQGQASKLCHMSMSSWRIGMAWWWTAMVTPAIGTAEREAAVAMEGELPAGGRITLGADKVYDTRDFIAEMRDMGVTSHVAQNNKGRRSAIDGRTTQHAGYQASVRVRKRIEEVFGWTKTVAGMRKTRHRGTALVGWMVTFTAAAAYNLVRLPKLLGATG
jgi:hypothetical protein